MSSPVKFSLSYQNHLYSSIYAQNAAHSAASSYPPAASVRKTAAFYPKVASNKENHAGIIDYYHNTQAQMETESDEHGVSNRDEGNLSVLAFAAMLGNEALEDN